MLESIGYRYKGEYNLPLRRMYDKKEPITIYLHVHQKGSAEITLNTMFRDYLIADDDVRNEYATLKKSIASDSANGQLVSTGITQYNLYKNDFIQKVLQKVGFDGLCVRLCTQEIEWSNYNEIANQVKGKKISLPDVKDESQKHLVLYHGTNIVAAARLQIKVPNAFLEFAQAKKENDPDSVKCLLQFVEKWLTQQDVKFITTSIDDVDLALYSELDYKVLGSDSETSDLIKYLG
jgi:hypothetical protein